MEEDFDAVNDALHTALLYGLEVEVVTFALRIMKGNSEMTIREAIQWGLQEWDLA